MAKRQIVTEIPIGVASAASAAAAEKHGMGALHVGIHVVEELLRQGLIEITEEGRNARG